ncbi:helix-turn-helix domain-containing protein [Nocardia sp. CA2R105]|uniref:helix-turn-helix domain-containing protein n=1 Tax=Nocardia coffeae TaxID=2873381 RepID=UPI001CA6BB13|nr:helix-turn-helix transcriptional regulator [Nocardia coffeae]MBY8857522.1 helix-turn-helix domain-containing protein [Nocardia coffeae]
MPAQPTTPSVPRTQVARILFKLHQQSGLYIKDVAEQINLHHTTVSKILKGEPCKLKPIYIDKMCDIYRVSDDIRADLKVLAAEAELARDWWYDFNDVVSHDKLDVFINLEASATTLIGFQNMRIPGLLQCEDYARALLRTSPDLTPDEVERHVQVRMRRKAILTRPYPLPGLDVILDEGVLRRVLGNTEVARKQLQCIAELSALPNVSVRLVPVDSGIYRGTEIGPFIILEFGAPQDREPDPSVVYLETGAGAGNLYLQKPDQVARYRQSWNDIVRASLSTAKTRAYLSKIAKELPR